MYTRYQSFSPNTKVTKFAVNERDLVDRMSRGWFPANSTLLRDLQRDFKNGSPERDDVISQIKGDPALFMHCARNLKRVMEIPGPGINPLEELRKLEDEKLAQILNTSAGEISTHDIKKLNKTLALRLQHSLISSHTAETVASQVEVSTDSAFCASSLRELGLNLLAWNYPQIYSKVFFSHRKKQVDLDSAWKDSVGVLPIELALRLASEWGVSADILTALGRPVFGESESDAAPKMSLREICETSELYAELQDPFHYPDAKERWEAREPLVRNVIDLSTLEEVKGKVKDMLAVYGSENSVVYSLPMAGGKPGEAVETSTSKLLSTLNPFAERCTEDIRDSFYAVYTKRAPNQVSLDAIRILIDKTAPACGFEQGCLYMLDNKTKNVIPALRIGVTPLDAYEPFLKRLDANLLPILFQVTPLKKLGSGINHHIVTQVFAGLDSPDYVGLLYLELAPQHAANPQHPTFLQFVALRKALNDCLG